MMDRVVFNQEEREVSFFGLMNDHNVVKMSRFYPVNNSLVNKLTENFCQLFPNHPDETNTAIILNKVEFTQGEDFISGGLHQIYFICSHYEDAPYEEIEKLPIFMQYLRKILKTDDDWSLPLLHAHGEKIIFSAFVVYEEYDEVEALLLKNNI